MISRPEPVSEAPRRGFLVGVPRPTQPPWLVEEHLDELAELARTAGVEVVGRAVQQRRAPEAATFIGRGKAEEIGRAVDHLSADLVLFDDDLSPRQLKNLERILERQVTDRSALILEIFQQRARTREARTQVELARLRYLLPRLTRRWTHLSRQTGGIGVRGGEGEKQLEADRRILRRRIGRLERDLERIERTRRVQRKGRRGLAAIALTGYTNAGKSTLFNRLTRAGVRAESRLFATLDSTLRRGVVAPGRPVLFADTVGFIRKLPHHLVASFRSTLEEIARADLVLHIVDASHPRWQEHRRVGDEVLEGLGVERDRVLRVFNKTDRVEGNGSASTNGVLRISALRGDGIAELKAALAARLD